MSNENITQEEISAMFPKAAEMIADALGCDIEKVQPTTSLINDLGAESIDFLDIIFRLERGFKVKIPRGKIVEQARGPLSAAEFAHCRFQIDGTEIGPHALREVEFGIGGLPQQEIGEAFLATGADEEINVTAVGSQYVCQGAAKEIH